MKRNTIKLNYLIKSINDKDSDKFASSLLSKLETSHWIKYADEYILDKVKVFRLSQKKADKIAEKVIKYLRDNDGQWVEENKASLVIDFLFEHLSDEAKTKVICAYSTIYCDTSRRSHYPQKMFADKIFSQINSKKRWKAIRDEVVEMIERYKEDENIFSDDTDEKNKQFVIRKIEQKFAKIIDQSDHQKIEIELQKMYENA